MNEKELLYYLTLILKQVVIYQGEFDAPKVDYKEQNKEKQNAHIVKQYQKKY